MSIQKLRPGLLLVCAALFAAACAPKKLVKRSQADIEAAEAARRAAEESENASLPSPADVEEARIHGKEFVNTADLQPILFEYDAYSLGDEGRGVLRANADYIKQHPDYEILIEGHTDERGTTEYNLALGQKRAKAVREYYIRLGVKGAKLATITFGKERPGCKESEDACWSKNRRAETKIRAQVSSAPAPSGPTQVR